MPTQAASRVAPVSFEVAMQAKGNFATQEKQAGHQAALQREQSEAGKKIQEGQQTAKELRDLAAKEEDGVQAAIERARKAPTPSLNQHERSVLGRLQPPEVAQEVSDFDAYSSVNDEARRTGKTMAEVAAGRKPPITDIDSVREKVLNRMGSMDFFKQTISGFDQMSQEAQQAVVESFFAANPRLREIYMRQVREINKKVIQTPEISATSKDKQALEATARKEMSQNIEDLNRALGLTQGGSGGRQELTQDQIDQALRSGDADRATLDLYDQLLKNNGVPEPSLFRRHFTLQRQIARIQAGNGDATQIPLLQTELKTVDAAIDYAHNGTQFATLEVRLNGLVYGDENPVGGRIGGISGYVDKLMKNQGDVNEAQTPTVVNQEAVRQAQEQQSQMEAYGQEVTQAMHEALGEVASEMHTYATDLHNRKSEVAAQQAEEEGKYRKRDAIRCVNAARNARGVETTDKKKGKKIIHQDKIGEDIRVVINPEDNGGMRLMLRDLSAGNPPIISLFEMENGQYKRTPQGDKIPRYHQIDAATGKPIPGKPATWENVDLASLNDIDRQLLEDIYREQGAAYEDRLLTDYFFAKQPPIKNIERRGNPKSIRLDEAELADLALKFGDRAEQNLDKSQQAKEVLERLKAKGVRVDGKGLDVLMLVAIAAPFGMDKYKKRKDD